MVVKRSNASVVAARAVQKGPNPVGGSRFMQRSAGHQIGRLELWARVSLNPDRQGTIEWRVSG